MISTSAIYVSADDHCSMAIILQTVRYRMCLPRRFLAPTCSGSCHSYSTIDRDTLEIHRSCQCCKPQNVTSIRLNVRCPSTSGRRRYTRLRVPFKRIHSCLCRPCMHIGEVTPGELIQLWAQQGCVAHFVICRQIITIMNLPLVRLSTISKTNNASCKNLTRRPHVVIMGIWQCNETNESGNEF